MTVKHAVDWIFALLRRVLTKKIPLIIWDSKFRFTIPSPKNKKANVFSKLFQVGSRSHSNDNRLLGVGTQKPPGSQNNTADSAKW